MKLILENWKKYLKEEEEKPLGKYVFPKDMIDPDPEKEKEINTALEDKLRDVLSDHFSQTNLPDRGLKKADSVADIQGLIDKNLYPEIFKRYTKGEVYRGIYVTRKWMEQTFGDTGEFEALHKESDPEMVEVVYNTIIPLYPGRLASSWTTDKDQAMKFAKPPSGTSFAYGKDISLVLVADAIDPQNYFIDMQPFYDYKFGKTFSKEAEVVAVGDVKTTKLIWKDTAAFTQRMKYLKQGFYKK